MLLFIHYSIQRKLQKYLMPSHTLKVSVYSHSINRLLTKPLNIFLGAAIIRMMNDFLGEATFREGVKIYLNEKYSKDLKKKTSRAE